MKVQILLDGKVACIQLISVESMQSQPTLREVKRLALMRALEDRALTISQSLRVSFQLFDVMGEPVSEDDYNE